MTVSRTHGRAGTAAPQRPAVDAASHAQTPRPVSTPVRLVRVGWLDLPHWADDDHAASLDALRRTARRVALAGPHKTGALGIRGECFTPALEASLAADGAKGYFEDWFVPYRIRGGELGGPDGGGFVTGFYEPDLEVSADRSAEFAHPIHASPAPLVKNDGTLRADYAWGWRDANGDLREAPDRPTIERDARADGSLTRDWPVLAWARDRVDLFFAHVQGAARLHFPDGVVRRVTYAAKSGHPFTGIGRELVAMGEIAPPVSMGSIRDWLARHPDRLDEVLHRNRSYIFFREAAVDDSALGPVAAAKVPLAPGRSLAVDRLLHTFGTPVHVHAPTLRYEGRAFARLMVAQETGTAIVGAARGDIFTGSGAAAGEVAGAIAHPAAFAVLVPRPARGAEPALATTP